MTRVCLTPRNFAFAWFAAAAVFVPYVLDAFPADKAPPAGSLTAGQLKSEIERLQRDIKAKRDSSQAPEAWKKLRQAETRLEEARAASRKEADAIREEISKLTVNPAAARWGNAIDNMQRRLRELETKDWKLTKNEGLRLFEARHAELGNFLRFIDVHSAADPARRPEAQRIYHQHHHHHHHHGRPERHAGLLAGGHRLFSTGSLGWRRKWRTALARNLIGRHQ
jgi:hypothetical protein